MRKGYGRDKSNDRPIIERLRSAADAVAYIKQMGEWPTDPREAQSIWYYLVAIDFDFPAECVAAAMPSLQHLRFDELANVMVRHPELRNKETIDRLLSLLQEDGDNYRNVEKFKRLIEKLPAVWTENKPAAMAALVLHGANQSLTDLLKSPVLTDDDRVAVLKRAIEHVDVKDRSVLLGLRQNIMLHGGPNEAATLLNKIQASVEAELKADAERTVVGDYIDGKADWNDVKLYFNDAEGYRKMRLQEAKDLRSHPYYVMMRHGPFGYRG